MGLAALKVVPDLRVLFSQWVPKGKSWALVAPCRHAWGCNPRALMACGAYTSYFLYKVATYEYAIGTQQ